MSDFPIAELGFVLVILGLVIAFVAMVLFAVRSMRSGGKTRGGGVLLIGPIPIIFGTDKESVRVVMVLAIILIAVVLAFMIIPWLLTR